MILTSFDLATYALKAIFEVNFKGLTKLEDLLLDSNKLQSIPRGTFDSLIALKWLDLRKFFSKLCFFTYKLSSLGNNSIKHLNANVFKMLRNLEFVKLKNNSCIERDFVGTMGLEALPHVVGEQCGYCDVTTQCEISDQMREMHVYFNALYQNIFELMHLENEVRDLRDEIKSMKMQR